MPPSPGLWARMPEEDGRRRLDTLAGRLDSSHGCCSPSKTLTAHPRSDHVGVGKR